MVKNLQKYAIMIIQKIRTCFAKQEQLGSYMYVGYSSIRMNIVTRKSDYEIANLYFKKYTIQLRINTVPIEDQTRVNLFFS